jgi:hypothetical protein
MYNSLYAALHDQFRCVRKSVNLLHDQSLVRVITRIEQIQNVMNIIHALFNGESQINGGVVETHVRFVEPTVCLWYDSL